MILLHQRFFLHSSFCAVAASPCFPQITSVVVVLRVSLVKDCYEQCYWKMLWTRHRIICITFFFFFCNFLRSGWAIGQIRIREKHQMLEFTGNWSNREWLGVSEHLFSLWFPQSLDSIFDSTLLIINDYSQCCFRLACGEWGVKKFIFLEKMNLGILGFGNPWFLVPLNRIFLPLFIIWLIGNNYSSPIVRSLGWSLLIRGSFITLLMFVYVDNRERFVKKNCPRRYVYEKGFLLSFKRVDSTGWNVAEFNSFTIEAEKSKSFECY